MLAERGLTVVVIVSDDGVQDYEIGSDRRNIVVVRFNPALRSVPVELGGTAKLSYAFYSIAKELVGELGAPHIIESQDYLGIAYYLQQFKLLRYEPFRDIPVLITIHAPAFIYLRYNKVPVYRFPDFWTAEMEKNSIRAADCLISPSRFMADEVGRHLDLSAVPPLIVPYPYRPVTPPSPDGPDAAVRPAPSPTPFHRNKIVYYGKLSPQKGTFELLRYFRELWTTGFPHPLHVIGGTDIVYHPEKLTMGQVLEREYGQYIRNGKIILHPAIDPASIGQALSDAHVILLPSIVDNLPFVCLETMSCGKLVLASVQGGQREIIQDGENGFLFDHSCPESFADKLRHILQLSDEEALRIEMNAINTIDRYSYDNIAPGKMAVIDNLARFHRPPVRFPFVHQEIGPASQALPPLDPTDRELPSDLLSVVIPFYNLGYCLDECIRSVLASNYPHLEIIVVNDGSTGEDNEEALRKWRDHPNVTIIDQVNRGLPHARNTGARRANGRFLAFLDADDAILPDYYEKAIRVLLHYDNVHFAGCWVRYFEGASGIWPSFNPSPPYLLTHNTINSSALVYKKASFLKGGLNDPALIFGLEDYESVVSMLHQGLNGIALPECLHRYRVRAGSMFRQTNGDKLLYSNGYIQEKHRAYYQRFAIDVAQLLNSNGPGYLYENPTMAIYVSSHTEKSGSWQARLKLLAKRNKRVKNFLLRIKKYSDRVWKMVYNTGW
jgi:glycosyltransferase involved in cell wall biosynthesis